MFVIFIRGQPVSYQYGRWMRAQLIPAGQNGGKMRNGVELVVNDPVQEDGGNRGSFSFLLSNS